MESLVVQGMGRQQAVDAVFNAIDRSGWWMKERPSTWARGKNEPVFTSWAPNYTASIHGVFAKAKDRLGQMIGATTRR